MIDLELTWQQAGAAAGGLIAASVALRASRRRRLASAAVFTQETGFVLGLFALWQLAGSFTVIGPGGALARSRWIWNFERTVHLPSEAAIQRLFLPHPLLVQFFNLYYDSLHFPVLIATLVWLFVWHRDSYLRIRTTLVGLTGLCLLVQLIPVAPPRMLPGTGMVDTAVKYHQSVYATVAGFDPDQLSAMPSVHVGWAILVAVAIIGTARTRWRWLAVLYPMMTTLAVIVTANHFWLDGIVAGLILALVLAVQAGTRRAVSRLRRTRAPEPARPEQLTPAGLVVADGLVADGQPDALRQRWGEHDELARTDDGAAQ
jgi:PAP2 superfamily